jgi:hypothetical protein
MKRIRISVEQMADLDRQYREAQLRRMHAKIGAGAEEGFRALIEELATHGVRDCDLALAVAAPLAHADFQLSAAPRPAVDALLRRDLPSAMRVRRFVKAVAAAQEAAA